jgi:hypothetical protein
MKIQKGIIYVNIRKIIYRGNRKRRFLGMFIKFKDKKEKPIRAYN